MGTAKFAQVSYGATANVDTKRTDEGLPFDKMAILPPFLRTNPTKESEPASTPHLLEVIDATAGVGAVAGSASPV